MLHRRQRVAIVTLIDLLWPPHLYWCPKGVIKTTDPRKDCDAMIRDVALCEVAHWVRILSEAYPGPDRPPPEGVQLGDRIRKTQ